MVVPVVVVILPALNLCVDGVVPGVVGVGVVVSRPGHGREVKVVAAGAALVVGHPRRALRGSPLVSGLSQ